MDEWERALRETFHSHAEPIHAAPDLTTAARSRSRVVRIRQTVALSAVVPVALAAVGFGVANGLPSHSVRTAPLISPSPGPTQPAWFADVRCGEWSTPTVRVVGAKVASGLAPKTGPFSPGGEFHASRYYRDLVARYGKLWEIASDFQFAGAAPAAPGLDFWIVGGTSAKPVMSVVIRVDKRLAWSAVPVEKTGCSTRSAPAGSFAPRLPDCPTTGHATTALAVSSTNGPGGVRFTTPCLYAPASQPLTLTIDDAAYAGGTGTPIPLDHLFLYRAEDLSKIEAYGTGPDTAVATIGTIRSGRRTVDLPALQPGRYMIYGGPLDQLTELVVR